MLRALYTMLGDLLNFAVLILLAICGFSLSLYIGTNGEAKSFESAFTAARALIYAILGEIDYEQVIEDTECIEEARAQNMTWENAGCNNNIASYQRSFVNTIFLILWIVIAGT